MRLALSHTQGAGPHLAVTPPLPGPGGRARPLGPDSGARAGSSLSGRPLAADRSQGSRSGSPRAPQGPPRPGRCGLLPAVAREETGRGGRVQGHLHLK